MFTARIALHFSPLITLITQIAGLLMVLNDFELILSASGLIKGDIAQITFKN